MTEVGSRDSASEERELRALRSKGAKQRRTKRSAAARTNAPRRDLSRVLARDRGEVGRRKE